MNSHSRHFHRLLALALLLLTALSLSLSAAAEEVGEEVAGSIAATTTEALPEGHPEEEGARTASALIADFLGENAAGLLSGATFLLTLAVTYLFRRRLIPPLLESLASLLGKSREAIVGAEAIAEREAERAERLLARVEELIGRATEAADRAESAALALHAGESAERLLHPLLKEQVDLLYELLISANLPQYQKDRIGAAHAAAMALLGESDHE